MGTTGSKLKRAEHLGFPSESLFDVEKKTHTRLQAPNLPSPREVSNNSPQLGRRIVYTLLLCAVARPRCDRLFFEGFYFLSSSQH